MVFSGFFDEPKQQRSRPKFTEKEKVLHYKAQGGKCNGCGKKFEMRNLTVDHIKAFSKGGGERGHNLQLLCGACNSMKGNRTQAQFEKQLVSQGIVKESPKAKPKVAAAKKTDSIKKAATAKKSSAKKTTKKPKDPFADFFSF